MHGANARRSAPSKHVKVDFSEYDKLLNFTVVDSAHGELGQVADILSAANQKLAQVNYDDSELLIPLNDETIVKIDHDGKKLYTNLPDGLLDINS